ncbi:hypothetical protein BGW36DRAFT_429932 [Talaromyces proteolyticus]|uniref:Uncharacterized protein n=1 Tax=Talaromyces proteolyticus TaxID=1131652 RepID=A0AAD4KMS6_9EURO|nr:uncharacterized protein BGW36DRAFT_429932 [Talaromyces proteolyticus]KAH8693905.1 hypothetical protein BGW36DRAFT_429932 [Talaromyces proteolyticus]
MPTTTTTSTRTSVTTMRILTLMKPTNPSTTKALLLAEPDLASVKKTGLVVTEDSTKICPHGTLRMVGEEMPRECRESENLADSAWSKNVPVGDDFLYNGPLPLFKDEDFESLRNAKAVAQLM